MKLLNFLFSLLFSTLLLSRAVLSLNLEGASADVVHDDIEVDDEMENTVLSGDESSSLRGPSRFLAQHKSKTLKCNKLPRVCRAKGSPGPDCCKKKCVNVMTDKLNCGMCGNKCKHGQICCQGKCVNPSFDKRNCGGCNKKCKKGEFCAYGMCSYA